MNSFTLNSKDYKLNKISAFKQFHIVRRLAPALKNMAKVATKASKKTDLSEEDMIEQIGPIIDGISMLSDKDSEFVLIGLLESVEMKEQVGNWAFIAKNGQVMYDNLDLPILLQLAGRAFWFNMQGFFSALPQTSHGQG